MASARWNQGVLAAAALIAVIWGTFEACSIPETGLNVADANPADGQTVLDSTPDSLLEASTDSGLDAPLEVSAADPGQLTGLQLWLIGDRGIEAGVAGDAGTDADAGADGSTLVLQWADQSPSQLVAQTAGADPPELVGDGLYGSKPTLSFSGKQSLTIASFPTLVQPYSVFIVGNAAAGGVSNLVFLSASTSAFLYRGAAPSAPQDTFQVFAGSPSGAPTTVVTGPSIMIAVIDGLNSRLYTNANNETDTSAGSNPFGGSITIGSFIPATPVYSINGRIAEIAVFNRSLAGIEARELNLYATARYGIAVSP